MFANMLRALHITPIQTPASHLCLCEPRTAVVRFNQELDLDSWGWGSEGGWKWGGLVGGEC